VGGGGGGGGIGMVSRITMGDFGEEVSSK